MWYWDYEDNGNSHTLLISNAMYFSEVWGGLFQIPVILNKFSFFAHFSKSDCTGQREKGSVQSLLPLTTLQVSNKVSTN